MTYNILQYNGIQYTAVQVFVFEDNVIFSSRFDTFFNIFEKLFGILTIFPFIFVHGCSLQVVLISMTEMGKYVKYTSDKMSTEHRRVIRLWKAMMFNLEIQNWVLKHNIVSGLVQIWVNEGKIYVVIYLENKTPRKMFPEKLE